MEYSKQNYDYDIVWTTIDVFKGSFFGVISSNLRKKPYFDNISSSNEYMPLLLKKNMFLYTRCSHKKFYEKKSFQSHTFCLPQTRSTS